MSSSPSRNYRRKLRKKESKVAASAQAKTRDSYGYDNDSHHLISRKVIPESLRQLQEEILLPDHRDIFLAASKEPSFTQALGMIAAKLDILLDGDYDVPDLCELLVNALRTRRNHGNHPHTMDPRLLAVDLVEKDKEVTIEFAGGYFDPALLPTPSMDGFTAFMHEHGCKICENRAACSKANQCLGPQAFEEGVVE